MSASPRTPSTTQRTFGDRTLSEWVVGVGSTAVICALIAWMTQLMNEASYWLNLRISLGFGISMVLTINLSHLAWPDRSELFRNGIGVSVGLAIGMVNLLAVIFGNPFQIDFREQWALILGNMAISAMFSLIVFYFFYTTYRVQRLHREVSEHQLQAARKDKDLMLSQLKLMQSQIEPHFLFNTLANVQGLIDQDSAAAKQLVGELTTMLRASLRRTRQDQTRLDEELTIVRSYLAIQAIRMGDRLRFSIDVPDALGDVPLPPLLIQPLVENAVVHGIEPSPQGGCVDVLASREEGRLLIRIRDTGLGLGNAPKSSGEGVGLSNVRDRLRMLYGDAASLTLKPGEEQGTEVCLRVPLSTETPTNDG
ncbi:sensor histidine kinase [Saccharospirillum salsuginis]|uniref:histidine kinase n=1 Tax=Saccharospirillum salsuginis TaxID=418750 RepID=A0A918N9P0_9GAMM|nr:histidine kinase [Saccharospirillum salsuginis]GGX54338.1 ATPase [Saccharospirillum salsuginis]